MLIAKPGKDSQILQNWRPISLLNTDYKILTIVIFNRLIEVLLSVRPIGIQQYGFMKNRFIGECCRIVSDVLDLTKQKKVTACLLAKDMEKAFDTIKWNFLFKALKWFNFKEYFISVFIYYSYWSISFIYK